ncbi:GNAT family N-acetyltransferase [Actinoplanes sp. Pm04-4]|uniref:GNAT family N-acetyltransferase n=1 Tax=Paractinoplanes pyxinae TaxID=2997416 RepID=A0ABT4ASY8_9ACTN|nr:GNAT family N-acetyltransferase [Actinoplanes pyxinae]MCY1136825.1 GNAT family N-acetyltransferase [Actinoplanes pyxinae]
MPDSKAMGQWFDLMVAAPDFLAPSRREHEARFEHPWPATVEEVSLARDGDQVVGGASYLLPQAENQHMLQAELVVHPKYRRRGIGTGLMNDVVAAARRHGRSLIEVEVARPGDGYDYLKHRGHRPGMTSIRSRLEVTDAEVPSPADGYSLVQWRDAVPSEIIGDVAALQGRLSLATSTGGPQVFDPDRVWAQEATQLGRGHRWYSTAARHDATGRIVARTKLAFESDDDAQARQRITIVEPAHRGHGLGLAVKAANHAYARSFEPRMRYIEAWNAENNTHMRAVNAKLGFKPVDEWCVFQLPA